MTLSDRLCTAECGICGSSVNGCGLGICRGFVNRGVYPVRLCVLCVCETAILSCSMHCDVNCSCGLCWTLVWHVCFFFPSCFMFKCSTMESMHMVAFTTVIPSVHLFHTPAFSPPPPPPSSPYRLPSPLPSSFLLHLVLLLRPLAVSGSLIHFFFPLPAPLALPPSRGGTVMFMKPFNVLCNYPGNTSHHYSCQ